ncbi:unnamed protein product [Paramecium sonneborni]|uniref:Uncharacterized protein n=1 Tax=Paramecium sonneborni TaxID=65129 RepID=A0A8S1QB30_9CILI|nr:unnamed protein product [Paramecium sonneborni]
MEKMEMVSSQLPLVKDRGEWNQQTFIIRPKYEKKTRQSIDNQLEIQFPLHREFDFVANHAMGFKGKGNVDLFKFYYRLYMKNKFAIQKIRKEKKIKDGQKKNEITKKQQLNQTEEPNTEEIRNAYKTIQIKPPSQQKQLTFVRECIKNLQEKASIVNKHIEFPKIVTQQTQVKIVNMDATKIPQAKTRDQQLELEELMLSRVVQAIQESQVVSHEDVRKVREIILQRHNQLSEMERELQLNQILGIKKQIYEREVAMKNELNKPPGIDNPDNFNELSSIQEISLIRSMQFKSQPNVSVTEYKFNNYEDEPESNDITNKSKIDLKQKQIEETLIQEQSTEMQSILQQIRSTSMVNKGNDTEHSKDKIVDKNNKLLPTLKFLEQAKQQIAQRSDNDSQQLSQPYFQPDIEDTSKSKFQQSLSMVSQLQNKTSKTIKSSINRSNQLPSSQSNHHSNQLSLEKKPIESMRKSAYKQSQLNEDVKPKYSTKELDDSDEFKFERQNYYEMKFSQILQRVIDQKKIQGGEESQYSQTLSQVESETVQKITQNLVTNIINMHKNPTPVMDQPSTFNCLDIESDDQEKVTQSIPLMKNEEIPDEHQRHLSYNRDITHLDHTFKIESQVSLSDKKLNEEQIANIIQQISQQLQQAQIPHDQIQKQLDDVTNILIRHPIGKLSSKLLRQSTTIMQNEPTRKIYLEETRYPAKQPKITHHKEQIDYLKFYEENAPTKQEKSRKSYKMHDQSKRSKQSTILKNMSEDERKQFLDSHKMNLQERANSQEMDEEMQFLQSVLDDQKKQREQIFTKKSQHIQSGKNTSRDQIDFDESSEKQQNTFRSHNPPTNINYESDQIKQGQTETNFNIKRPQIKQKTDQTSNKSENAQQFQISSQQGTQRSEPLKSKTKRTNQDEQQGYQPDGSSKSQITYKSLKQGYKDSSDKDNEKQEIYSPNTSVEEVPHQDEQDPQTDQEDEQYEEIQQQIDENDDTINVATKRSVKPKTERSKKSDPKQSERSKKSKQSDQQSQLQITKQNLREKTQQSQYKEQEQILDQQQNSQKNILQQPIQKQISSQQQQEQIQQEQNNNNNNEDRQIKLNFQRQDSNQNVTENSSQQIYQQQQLKNRTNLQDIQLKSFQASQNQSLVNSSGTPQQNNTPVQVPGRKQGSKKTKFEDQSNNSNTPQARLQRVKTKLSRFQEATNNNDEDEYDYDWDEEDPSNKKKKITSKSSKSTLRNDIQSPSISPMAKQQNQAIIAKKKVYDLKQEYELIAKQNLSLADLKRDIEKKISQLQSPDDEAKYNIYLYEQRQKQLKNLPQTIEGLINDKRDNEDACGDTIRKFHENRMRYKDVIEKDQTLKFTNQIQLDDDQQTQINTQSHLDEYMKEVQMNIQRMIQQVQLEQMRDHPEVRKECFDYDTSIIQQRKMESQTSEIVQTQAQMKIYEEPTQETQKKTEYVELDSVMSNIIDKKFDVLAQKLRALKFKNPEKFNQIVNTEIVKAELFLSTTKHKYILE